MRAGRFGLRAASYKSLLGDQLLDFWISTTGITLSSGKVSSWKSVRYQLSLVQANSSLQPAYGADGSHFRGNSVVQCDAATMTGLTGTGFSLGAYRDPITLVTVARIRTQPSTAQWVRYLVQCTNAAGTAAVYASWRADSAPEPGWGGYWYTQDVNNAYLAQWWSSGYAGVGSWSTPSANCQNTYIPAAGQITVGECANEVLGAGVANWAGYHCGPVGTVKVGNTANANVAMSLDSSIAMVMLIKGDIVSSSKWLELRKLAKADYGAAFGVP